MRTVKSSNNSTNEATTNEVRRQMLVNGLLPVEVVGILANFEEAAEYGVKFVPTTRSSDPTEERFIINFLCKVVDTPNTTKMMTAVRQAGLVDKDNPFYINMPILVSNKALISKNGKRQYINTVGVASWEEIPGGDENGNPVFNKSIAKYFETDDEGYPAMYGDIPAFQQNYVGYQELLLLLRFASRKTPSEILVFDTPWEEICTGNYTEIENFILEIPDSKIGMFSIHAFVVESDYKARGADGGYLYDENNQPVMKTSLFQQVISLPFNGKPFIEDMRIEDLSRALLKLYGKDKTREGIVTSQAAIENSRLFKPNVVTNNGKITPFVQILDWKKYYEQKEGRVSTGGSLNEDDFLEQFDDVEEDSSTLSSDSLV